MLDASAMTSCTLLALYGFLMMIYLHFLTTVDITLKLWRLDEKYPDRVRI